MGEDRKNQGNNHPEQDAGDSDSSDRAENSREGVIRSQLDEILEKELGQKLSDVSEEIVERIEEHHFIIKEEHNGPLPHPSILKGYEEITPGFADRILSMAERALAHTQDQEDKALSAEIDYNHFLARENSNEVKRGQIFGFCMGVIAISWGGYVALNGAQIAGSFIGTGGVIGLVTAFILGRKGIKSQEHESSAKGSVKKPENKK